MKCGTLWKNYRVTCNKSCTLRTTFSLQILSMNHECATWTRGINCHWCILQTSSNSHAAGAHIIFLLRRKTCLWEMRCCMARLEHLLYSTGSAMTHDLVTAYENKCSNSQHLQLLLKVLGMLCTQYSVFSSQALTRRERCGRLCTRCLSLSNQCEHRALDMYNRLRPSNTEPSNTEHSENSCHGSKNPPHQNQQKYKQDSCDVNRPK